jgi:DNA-binding transcriptional MerR regulator
MRIGELAARAGVTTKAIRYYEERGLVKARRTPAGYRDFDDTSLEVIAMIRNAQRLGVKLGEMDEIIALIRDRQRPCASVRGIIRAKRRDVAERIASLIELDKSQSRTIAHRHRQSGSRRPRPFCRRELPHRSAAERGRDPDGSRPSRRK